MLVCVAMGPVGCGDSGGTSMSASDSASASGGSSTSASASSGTSEGSVSDSVTAATEGGNSVSDSASGTTDQGGSDSNGETMGGGSGPATTGTSGQDSQGGSGGTSAGTTEPVDTTGEPPIDCGGAQTKDECVMLGCQPIEGNGFESDGAMWCLKANPSYLGCIEPSACAEVITYVCKGQNVYQLPNACAPNGYKPCEAPPDQNMNGYPTC